MSSPGRWPAFSIASRISSIAASFVWQRRREAALVAYRRRQPSVVEQPEERVVHLGPHPHRLSERRRSDRRDHELLEVRRVLCVLPAVQDVEQRHRQEVRLLAAEVPVQRHCRSAAAACATANETPRMALAPRSPLFGVPSSAIIVSSIVRCSVAGVPMISRCDHLIDVLDRLQHALAAVARLVAVA